MTVYTGPSAAQGGVIAKGEAIAYNPEIWLPLVIRNRAREFSLARYTDAMGFNGKKGDTVRKPYIGQLKSQKKLPGQPLQFQSRKEGEWKMMFDRYSYSAFSVDRFLDFTTEIDIAKEYTPEIARALMEEVELSLLAERATFISYSSDNHVVSNVPFDFPDFMAAYERLMLLGVKPNEMVFHVGPQTWVTMFTIDEFIKSGEFNSGDLANIKSGSITGTMMGVPVVLNHNIRTNSLTGVTLGGDDYDEPGDYGEQVATPGMEASPFKPTQYGSDRYSVTLNTWLSAGYVSNLLTTRKSIALAMVKRPSLEIWWNPDYQETRFASTQVYDVKVVDPRIGVVISTTEG